MRCGWGFLYLKYVGKPPPPAPTMPAWRMISTASSTLRVLTSSRLRRFISAMIRLVDFDAGRDVRVVELGCPGLGMLHRFGNLVARIDGLHRAFWHAHGAVDALGGVDHELVIGVVDAVHRARPYASRVLRADTQFGDNIGHVVSPLLVPDSPETSLTNAQTLSTDRRTLFEGE